MSDLEIIPVTIPTGQTVSLPVPIGIKTPVSFDPCGLHGGALKFNASTDGGATFQPLFDATNTAVAISAPAGGSFIALNSVSFVSVDMPQIVVATAPTANTVIGLAVRATAF